MPVAEYVVAYAHFIALALAGFALAATVVVVTARGSVAARLGRACTAVRIGAALPGLAGGLMLHHGVLAPFLGMADGADRIVCCVAADASGVLTSADGARASVGGMLIDLERGATAGLRSGAATRLRAQWPARFDGGTAYFGSDAAPRRAAAFAAGEPLAVRFADGRQLVLSNPAGNCVVIADDGPVAAVVVSRATGSWLDTVVPLRGAGTIDFVDLRTGQTLRSVTVARLDGFACVPGRSTGARLVGTAGGARWVLAQERWVKVFDVRVPGPSKELRRALAAI